MGVRVWGSGLCFALSAYVMATLIQEFIRGANVRRGMTGTDLLTAMIGLVSRNKRRYGGYIVHVGIVLIFLGFAGEGLQPRSAVAAEAGRRSHGRRLHAAPRRHPRDRRWPEADGDGPHHREGQERRGAGADAAGQVVLPQARRRADHRGGDPPDVCRRPLRRDAGVRDRRADGQRRSAHQPARELGVVRLRHSGHRHRHRAAAGNGPGLRRGAAAGRRA